MQTRKFKEILKKSYFNIIIFMCSFPLLEVISMILKKIQKEKEKFVNAFNM